MNIALIGYGKMGKVIEEIALTKNYTIVAKFDQQNPINIDKLKAADVAFEFTNPGAAVQNLTTCFKSKVPVVSGTTGWLDMFEHAKQTCMEHKGTFFYASNFSLGVNILFQMNKKLASLMKDFKEYTASVSEIHHLQKKDAPSGTAISLANQILDHMPDKYNWVNQASSRDDELSIVSERMDNVSGIHTISYESDVDKLELKHVAKNRMGYGLGAIAAAEFIHDKQGIYSMNDLLKF